MKVIVILIILMEECLNTLKKTWEIGNDWKNLNHLDQSIVTIDKNTQKNPRKTRKLAVSKTPMKYHKPMLMGNIYKEWNSNDNNNNNNNNYYYYYYYKREMGRKQLYRHFKKQ